jgi:hypothetical protein
MGTPGRIGAGVVAGVLALGVLAQLLLPRIAASTVSSRLDRYGTVESVKVSAWPAVKLLWGSIDSLQVRARELTLSPAQTAKLLWEARDAARIELTAASVREGPLQMTDARLTKHDGALHAEARMSSSAVAAALPRGVSVRLLESGSGRARVRVRGGLFGIGPSVEALASPSAGKLVVEPVAPGLRALRLTLFSEPHIHVSGVSASVEGSGPLRYRLSISAALG